MKTPNYEVKILPQLVKACGLDMHKDKIVAFISNNSGTEQILQEFGTYTEDLHKIIDFLKRHGVKDCLMESTGVYWISLYHLLIEAGINAVVANPLHIKQMPKRKTDKKDASWLCMLLLNGLQKGVSFIPDPTQYQLRQYCRQRLLYTQQRSKCLNRIIKLLEQSNIKIRSVVSNIRTQSSMSIIRLLAAGETDIKRMQECCKGKLKEKIALMGKALQGYLSNSTRELIQMLLADVDHNSRQIHALEIKIKQLTDQYYQHEVALLQDISGVGRQSAEIIVSEIGINMNRFETADHLAAWCGVAPGNHNTADKNKPVGIRKGNPYLRTALVAVAWGAVKTKNSYWKCLFEKLRKRMAAQKAIICIARRLLKVIYKTIKTKVPYVEGGHELFLSLELKNKSLPNLKKVIN